MTIFTLAKKIRKKNEPWQIAIHRAGIQYTKDKQKKGLTSSKFRSDYTLTLITHNCQKNKRAIRLSLEDNKKFMAITCMHEPLNIIAKPHFGFRYKSQEVSCHQKVWPIFGIFTEFDFPIQLRLLNVHLNPNPWPKPGLQRSYDLKKTGGCPHIL